MAPSHSRHLLVWTTLPIAVLLSYLWFKRKRTEAQSDPGRTQPTDQPEKNLEKELREAEASEKSPPSTSKPISRSLSGVDSAPIDIIFPPELKSAKSSQIVVTDEDLDLEIEKIKSMKNSFEFYSKRKDVSASSSQPKAAQNTKEDTPKREQSPKVTLKQASPRKTGSSKKEDKAKEIETKSPIKPIPESSTKTEMAQKDIVTVSSIEKKINSLKIEGQESCPPQQTEPETPVTNVTDHDVHRQSSERDSANHSPADVMLASPSLSSISDSHSEGSSDSGKGCSEVATPPSRTPAGEGSVSEDAALPAIYEFVIPQSLVGRLIGRHGNFVTQIKNQTHAHILIKKHPQNNKLKICVIEGLQAEIEHALEMIREKFPLKRYAELTLEQVEFVPPPMPSVLLMPERLCLKLVEGINNDTMVTCMYTPNHLFLQLPTHPTFPNLHILTSAMNACYGDANSCSPMLPDPLPDMPVCAAYNVGEWHRAVIMSTNQETKTSLVKILDKGGFCYIKNTDLRQIHADFLTLPFQAAECVLAHIRPVGEEGAPWCQEAFSLVSELTKGVISLTQVAGYIHENLPLVRLYVTAPQGYVYLNEELVNRGYAEWTDFEEDEVEGAIGGASA